MRFHITVLFALVAAVFAVPVLNTDVETDLVAREAKVDARGCQRPGAPGCM